MILGARLVNFNFKFPKNFFPEEIRNKYDYLFKKDMSIYVDLTDYINSTIQSFDWGEMNTETIKQSFRDNDKIYKPGKDTGRYFAKDFSINFRLTEGFLNYLIMMDMIISYLALTSDNTTFVDDLYLQILDDEGNLVTQLRFEDVVFTGIGALTLNFTDNALSSKEFSCHFAFKSVYFDNQKLF